MSLPGLDRDTVTIKRQVITQGPAGGQIKTYTTAARGALPTTWKCRAQQMSVEEETRYGVRDDSVGWKFLSGDIPQVDTRDRIEFELDSATRVIRVLGRERNWDSQSIGYQVMGEEVFGES